MSVTRNDVARRAGVSTATVSHVLNKTKYVSPDLEKAVWEAVKELGYKPNRIARSMKTQQTMQVGILVDNLVNPIYAQFIQGFEEKALEKEYFVNVCTSRERISEYFDIFIQSGLDGVLLETLPGRYAEENIHRLLDAGIKVLMFSHYGLLNNKISTIENDYTQGMALAIAHLKDLGHENIAYLNGLGGDSDRYDLRRSAYASAMKSAGLEHKSKIIDSESITPMTLEAGYQLGKTVMEKLDEISALICTNDLLAFGVIHYLQENDKSVPDDLSVIGFDDNIHCDYFTPRLTSIHASYTTLGSRAFELLYRDIRENENGYYLNPLELKIRESTKRRI